MPQDTPTPTLDEATLAEQLQQNLAVLRRMREVLLIVSTVALVTVGILLFLYLHTRPELVRLNHLVDTQTSQLQDQRDRISDDCNNLASREFRGQDFPAALTTLGECKAYFPDSYVLPNYEAEISIEHFQTPPHDPNDLERAANATKQSLQIAPNYMGYEWQGLVSCLRSATMPADQRANEVNAAVAAFTSEIRLHPTRKSSLLQSQQFSTDCPVEVRSAIQALP